MSFKRNLHPVKPNAVACCPTALATGLVLQMPNYSQDLSKTSLSRGWWLCLTYGVCCCPSSGWDGARWLGHVVLPCRVPSQAPTGTLLGLVSRLARDAGVMSALLSFVH